MIEGVPELDPLIRDFYVDRYDEDARLRRSRHGQLEFLRTQELLLRFLPPAPASLLDVGGGTGVHARWLAADGYRVRLIDPVLQHVEQAAAHGGFSAELGDARSIPAADSSADAVLLLGPLYHLVDAVDRALVLTEAVRVVRPGGVVITTGISRYAALLELTGLGEIVDDETVAELADLIDTGINVDDPLGFTTAYFHFAQGLSAEMTTAGLREVTVLGIEGPGVAALDNATEEQSAAVMESAIRSARLVEGDPNLIAASPHLLGVGYR